MATKSKLEKFTEEATVIHLSSPEGTSNIEQVISGTNGHITTMLINASIGFPAFRIAMQQALEYLQERDERRWNNE